MARTPSNWHKAHGTAAKSGRLVVLEPRPSDELPPACGPDPARADRDSSGRFTPGNRWARLAKVRSGPRGVLAALEAKADPAWRAARRWARRAAQHRIREYGELHGAVLSSGICGLLEDAALMRGDASYVRARAAAENDPELLRLAATLAASARQCERDAWELATREAAVQPKRTGLSRLLDGDDEDDDEKPPARLAPALSDPPTGEGPADVGDA